MILGIANHEGETVNYTVRVDLVGVQIVRNATSGFNKTVEVNRTAWSNFIVTVADRANSTTAYSFSIPIVGLWKVQSSCTKTATSQARTASSTCS